MNVKKIRMLFEESDNKRDEGLRRPEGIERFDDIIYGNDPKWQVLDVYRPKQDKDRILPVIVSVHGGGWVYGDKERYQYYCMSLAERGFAVVNFTYRLAPEFKFPAPVEDTHLIFSWVLEHAKEYNFDKENIFALGDSAGAQILALYTAICTNPAYASNYDFKIPGGFVPKGIGLNCGSYWLNSEGGRDDPTLMAMNDLLPHGGDKDEEDLLNVLKHLTKAYPPTFLMTAVKDFLNYQAPVMASKLAEVGVSFVYRFYSNQDKSLAHVFHCDMRNPYAHQCNDEECDFFKRLIHI